MGLIKITNPLCLKCKGLGRLNEWDFYHGRTCDVCNGRGFVMSVKEMNDQEIENNELEEI